MQLVFNAVLYIPHGSDESQNKLSKAYKASLLYIPHGSDESFRGKIYESAFDRLYIPHGSDESHSSMLQQVAKSFFISHMVQMKVLDVRPFSKAITSLYPTWFR